MEDWNLHYHSLWKV